MNMSLNFNLLLLHLDVNPVKYSEEIYTVWIIQIKNHNLSSCNSGVTEDSISKLEPNYVFSKTDLAKLDVSYLAMHWQLGAHQTVTEEVEWGIAFRTRLQVGQEPRRTHYTILGLKYFKVVLLKAFEQFLKLML